jgi:hypothetical protein
VAAGRPKARKAPSPLILDQTRRRTGVHRESREANEYRVSLEAIAAPSVTAAEVADVLGLPAEAFVSRPAWDREATVWRCYVEADDAVGLAEQIRFLASEVHPRRPYLSYEEMPQVFVRIGAFCRLRANGTYSVRLPLACLRRLVRKLFVMDVEVTCYPCRGRGDEEGEED